MHYLAKSTHLSTSILRLPSLWILVTLAFLNQATLAGVNYVSVDSGESGPTVIVLGLQQSGAEAIPQTIRQLSSWTINSGRFIVAYEQHKTASRYESDLLARALPKQAKDLADLVRSHKPDWLILLDEDYEFHHANINARGNTIHVHHDSSGARSVAEAMKAQLNRHVEPAYKKWSVLPATKAKDNISSTAQSNVVRLTTSTKNSRKEQRISLRCLDHRRALSLILEKLSMQEGETEVFSLVSKTDPQLKYCAIYDGPGAVSSSGHDPIWIARSIRHLPFDCMLIGPEDIAAGVLDQFDLLICGGGYSRKQASNLGETGRKHIKQFVRSGGGYVGICAGAYLALRGPGKLNFFACRVEKGGGSAVVGLTFNDAGRKALNLSGTMKTKLSGGPLLTPGVEQSNDVVWAHFEKTQSGDSDTAEEAAGFVAIVASQVERGRAVIFSPHCERWPGPQEAFWNALQWVTETKTDE